MRVERAQLAQILDLLAEDSRLNVYAGKLEVRPPGAPTTEPLWGIRGRLLVAKTLGHLSTAIRRLGRRDPLALAKQDESVDNPSPMGAPLAL
jgi:hypothetical protein